MLCLEWFRKLWSKGDDVESMLLVEKSDSEEATNIPPIVDNLSQPQSSSPDLLYAFLSKGYRFNRKAFAFTVGGTATLFAYSAFYLSFMTYAGWMGHDDFKEAWKSLDWRVYVGGIPIGSLSFLSIAFFNFLGNYQNWAPGEKGGKQLPRSYWNWFNRVAKWCYWMPAGACVGAMIKSSLEGTFGEPDSVEGKVAFAFLEFMASYFAGGSIAACVQRGVEHQLPKYFMEMYDLFAPYSKDPKTFVTRMMREARTTAEFNMSERKAQEIAEKLEGLDPANPEDFNRLVQIMGEYSFPRMRVMAADLIVLPASMVLSFYGSFSLQELTTWLFTSYSPDNDALKTIGDLHGYPSWWLNALLWGFAMNAWLRQVSPMKAGAWKDLLREFFPWDRYAQIYHDPKTWKSLQYTASASSEVLFGTGRKILPTLPAGCFSLMMVYLAMHDPELSGIEKTLNATAAFLANTAVQRGALIFLLRLFNIIRKDPHAESVKCLDGKGADLKEDPDLSDRLITVASKMLRGDVVDEENGLLATSTTHQDGELNNPIAVGGYGAVGLDDKPGEEKTVRRRRGPHILGSKHLMDRWAKSLNRVLAAQEPPSCADGDYEEISEEYGSDAVSSDDSSEGEITFKKK